PSLPQLVIAAGQTAAPIATPKVVGVFFANFDAQVAMTSWLAALPTLRTERGASYWSTAVGEYGVGPLTTLAPVVLSRPAPANVEDFDFFDEPKLAGLGADTIITVFFPETTAHAGQRCFAYAGGYVNDPRHFSFVSECAGETGTARVDRLTRN